MHEPALPQLERYDGLREAAAFSGRVLSQLSRRLEDGDPQADLLTVVIVGSLGRLECTQLSDADYIVVSKRPGALHEIVEAINRAVTAIGLEAPPEGHRLSVPVTPEELVGGMGTAAENPDHARKRLLILLEARPVLRERGFKEILDRICSRYSLGVSSGVSEPLGYLLDDLVRYYRHIAVREDQSWPARDVKLGHSRLVMFAGLLVLLGEASRQPADEQMDWVRRRLSLSPLERLAYAYGAAEDPNFDRVLEPYSAFITRWSSGEVRRQLSRLDDEVLASDATYRELALNSHVLRSELTRFILARRGRWSEAFFERLLL